jgi:hypothetical protein
VHLDGVDASWKKAGVSRASILASTLISDGLGLKRQGQRISFGGIRKKANRPQRLTGDTQTLDWLVHQSVSRRPISVLLLRFTPTQLCPLSSARSNYHCRGELIKTQSLAQSQSSNRGSLCVRATALPCGGPKSSFPYPVEPRCSCDVCRKALFRTLLRCADNPFEDRHICKCIQL